MLRVPGVTDHPDPALSLVFRIPVNVIPHRNWPRLQVNTNNHDDVWWSTESIDTTKMFGAIYTAPAIGPWPGHVVYPLGA